jgi:serine/threonine-protein kinase
MSEATTGPAGALTGTVLSGRYRLEQKLGSGGMSTVYLAKDETLERWVAAKVLHREISDQPDQIERFRREARAVAQVSHPNVVAVIDAGEDGGRPYIVFEYCDGETLKERIDRLGRLPLDEAAAYAIEVGRGLQAAHARRLVHRDVKPQNVLIDAEGRAKVTDFGIARELEQDGRLTKTGRVLGTTDYVSPEQAMGHAVDARSDIYSLGVLLYEMLTGDVPFKAENLVGVAMKHVNEPMPDVQRKRPEVSSALAAVVERSTEKSAEKRYRDMGAMLADLENALEVEVARAGRATGEATTVLDSVPHPRRRILTSRRVSIAGILLVLAATVAALVIAGLTGDGGRARGGGGGEEAPTGTEVELAAAEAFDPLGDDQEHSEEAQLAVDGDTATGWPTEEYTASAVVQDAAGKPGVGLVVDAGEPVEGSSISIKSAEGGWTAEVYAAVEGPPATFEEWGEPVGEAPNAADNELVELEVPEPSQYYLIWFTELTGPPGAYKVEISEVSLTAS